jgi:integrase
MKIAFVYSYSTAFKTNFPSHGTFGATPEVEKRYGQKMRMSVTEYLAQWLLDVEARVSLTTFERYDGLCRKSISPLIGDLRLDELRPIDISRAYAQALSAGNRKRYGGLAPRTVHHMHTVLKSALHQAVAWELISRNPAAAVRPPRVPRRTGNVYDFEQTAQLLRAAGSSPLYIAILLAVLCGLRRGEIAGLRWKDIDLKQQKLVIVQSAEQTSRGIRYKEPKSGRTRSIALSATMTRELAEYQSKQSVRLVSHGRHLGENDRVVMLSRPKPARPDAITHEWVRFLRNNPTLPRIRFHDLRHSHATHLLASGVHPKVASERLGHAQVGITLDTYSHVLPNMQAEAAVLVDKAIFDNDRLGRLRSPAK